MFDIANPDQRKSIIYYNLITFRVYFYIMLCLSFDLDNSDLMEVLCH